MITENTKFTFGKHKGKPLKNCPLDYLEWISTKLLNTDFHDWALASGEVHKKLIAEGATTTSLEEQANVFLRSHGIDPKRL
jgi:hypothetical protein